MAENKFTRTIPSSWDLPEEELARRWKKASQSYEQFEQLFEEHFKQQEDKPDAEKKK